MIYFIQSGKSGPIKIGYTSKNPKERLRSLQTASPKKLSLLGTIDGGIEDEKALHIKFKSSKATNEWFNPTDEVLSYLFKYHFIQKVENIDPLSFKALNLKEFMDDIEKKIIKQIWTFHEGNMTQTARFLGITRPTLYAKCKGHSIIE